MAEKPQVLRSTERNIMCSCGQWMRVDLAWELPVLIKCVRCGSQWCQISWGREKEKP